MAPRIGEKDSPSVKEWQVWTHLSASKYLDTGGMVLDILSSHDDLLDGAC